ncbi:MAG: hypothetical protein ACREFI_03750 [Stellaceae bacterium]
MTRRIFAALAVPRRLGLALGAAVLGSIIVYLVLVARMFPEHRLGDDYEYFLPMLLAGKYWIAQNGLLAAPRFSPAFCAGLPFLANPQSMFYSVPQELSLAVDPVRSFLATTVAFTAIGAVGTYALLRRRFGTSVPAACLSAVLFLLNGFVLHRMASGHATYHAMGLAPVLAYALLTPLEGSLARFAGATGIAAAILAYFVYAGAVNMLVPLGITMLAIWCIQSLARPALWSFWPLGCAASVVGAAAAAAKLAPALVFVHNFPRAHEIVLFDSPLELAHALFMGFFLPNLLPDHFWVVGRHEFQFGLGLVPLLLLLAAYHRFRSTRSLRGIASASWAKLALLGCLLAVPIAVNLGGSEYAAWLKSLPYVGDNVILVRWFVIYLLPLIVGVGLALDFVFKSPALRTRAALAGVLITALPPLVLDGPLYDLGPYDAAPTMAANETLEATRGVPPIVAIGNTEAQAARGDALGAGHSSVPCYEPLFGYRLESFPSGLVEGPILAEGSSAHLRNPACYIYGDENHCRPGEAFTSTQREDEAAFAAYRPFSYVLPNWQRWADRVTALGLIGILLLGLAPIAARLSRASGARARVKESAAVASDLSL